MFLNRGLVVLVGYCFVLCRGTVCCKCFRRLYV